MFQLLCFLLAFVLALVGSFVNPPRFSLLALAVALIALGLAVPGFTPALAGA